MLEVIMLSMILYKNNPIPINCMVKGGWKGGVESELNHARPFFHHSDRKAFMLEYDPTYPIT
jgi:hypothetical protein